MMLGLGQKEAERKIIIALSQKNWVSDRYEFVWMNVARTKNRWREDN